MADTPTEALFDRYLDLMGFPFQRIPRSSTPTADRRVVAEGITVIVEIEGFELSPKDQAGVEEIQRYVDQLGIDFEISSGLLSHNRCLRAIDSARPQLDRPEYAGLPRLVVIGGHPLVDARSTAHIQAALRAKAIPNDPISAVALIGEICPDESAFRALLHDDLRLRGETSDWVLRHYGQLWDEYKGRHPEFDLEKRETYLEVLENPTGAVPVPRSIFCGRHDRSWAAVAGGFQEVKGLSECDEQVPAGKTADGTSHKPVTPTAGEEPESRGKPCKSGRAGRI